MLADQSFFSTPEYTVHAKRIVAIIRNYDHILVAAHGSPDGDAIGSTAAMGWILKALGKQYALYNTTGVPDYLSWVNMPSRICKHLHEIPFKPELLVILDCGDAWRVGAELLTELTHKAAIDPASVDVRSSSPIPSLCIDHHLGNPLFASLYNWVEPCMASVGQMLAFIADAASVPLSDGLAEAIYLSLVSDTGSFTHGNTTGAVFELAARLLNAGLDAASIRNKLDNRWSLSQARLWGRLFGKLRLEKNGKLALCTLMLDDLKQTGAVKEDSEGFVEQMRKIRGVRVAALLREDAQGLTKLSMRSCGDDNVRIIAAEFGGGGHKNAAGANIQALPEKVEKMVLELINF